MFHCSLGYSTLVCLHGLTLGFLYLLWVLLQKHLLASSQVNECTKFSLPLLFLFGRPVPSLHCAVMPGQHPSGLNLNITSKTKSAAKPKIKLRLIWLPSEFVEWQMGERRDFCSCLEVTVQHCHRGLALCLEEIWFIICRDSILSDISSSKYSQLLWSSTANQDLSTVSGLSKGCLS